jgi:hypothetical protein
LTVGRQLHPKVRSDLLRTLRFEAFLLDDH